LVGAFFAADFLAGADVAVAFLAGAFFAAPAGARLVAAALAGAFFVAAALAGAFFVTLDFEGAFFVVVCCALDDVEAAVFLAGAFLAGDFLAGDFLAALPLDPPEVAARLVGAFFVAFFTGDELVDDRFDPLEVRAVRLRSDRRGARRRRGAGSSWSTDPADA